MTAAMPKDNATPTYVAHTLVVAALSTAAFMLLTAVELGPMGPLVIAEALYLAAFALVIELGLAARVAILTAKRVLARRLPAQGQEA